MSSIIEGLSLEGALDTVARMDVRIAIRVGWTVIERHNAVRVRMRTVAKGTVFNNRTPSASFLPIYDPETRRHLFEFTTDVEERLIAI